MIKYFSADYMLSSTPEATNSVLITYLVLFTITLISGIILSTILLKKSKNMPPYKTIRERIINHTLVTSILGFIFTFFLWQQIPYLSAPIVVYILLIVLVYLLIADTLYYKNTTVSELKRYKQELEYQKYLPKQSKQQSK